MIVNNAQEFSECFGEKHLYFFSIGYESRSFFLYDELQKKYPSSKPIIFALNNYKNNPNSVERIDALNCETARVFHLEYSDDAVVQSKILEIIQNSIEQTDSVVVHIDYSSMPRNWYCGLPLALNKILRTTDKVYFWYSEGEYPKTHEEYPSAGIEAFTFFSGKPSLQIEGNRIHMVALGYDVTRTEAILSITDPNYLVACYAYNPNRKALLENLLIANEPILARAGMSFALHIDDFEFMISKLCDTVNLLLPEGDVILIPDGPKPLIFALSLVPCFVGKQGVTCLHVSRNNSCSEMMDVTTTGSVFGFCIKLEG